VKKIVVIVALALFLKPILPVLDYIINYDYIANVLCENKAKPQLQCNGKCHLMKELAKESENEKPLSTDKKDNSKHEIEVLFYQDITSLVDSKIAVATSNETSTNYTNLYSFLNSVTTFHPPTFIS
jgi:hypothetical protein